MAKIKNKNIGIVSTAMQKAVTRASLVYPVGEVDSTLFISGVETLPLGKVAVILIRELDKGATVEELVELLPGIMEDEIIAPHKKAHAFFTTDILPKLPTLGRLEDAGLDKDAIVEALPFHARYFEGMVDMLSSYLAHELLAASKEHKPINAPAPSKAVH